MEIRHRTISDLRLNAYGKSKSDMIAEMQENCEVYNELVAPVTYNENDFIFEWESSEVITICKKKLAESDWRASKAADTGTPVPEAWRTYRQALRDLINSAESGEVNWPENLVKIIIRYEVKIYLRQKENTDQRLL